MLCSLGEGKGLQNQRISAFGLGLFPEVCPFKRTLTLDLHRLADVSGLPFCRAFVVMNFHSESLDFIIDFCVISFNGLLKRSVMEDEVGFVSGSAS